MNLENILNFVNVWRTANGITGNVVLTEAQQKQFARDLQGKVNEFSVHPERVNWGKYDPNAPMTWSADARVIPYSADVGKLPAWGVAESISRDGKGKTFFISDTPAGQLLNSEEFQDAVRDTIGGADSVAGKTLQERLFNGTWLENGTRMLRPFTKTIRFFLNYSQVLCSVQVISDTSIIFLAKYSHSQIMPYIKSAH